MRSNLKRWWFQLKGGENSSILEKMESIIRKQTKTVLEASQTMAGKILKDMCDDSLLVRKGKGKI